MNRMIVVLPSHTSPLVKFIRADGAELSVASRELGTYNLDSKAYTAYDAVMFPKNAATGTMLDVTNADDLLRELAAFLGYTLTKE